MALSKVLSMMLYNSFRNRKLVIPTAHDQKKLKRNLMNFQLIGGKYIRCPLLSGELRLGPRSICFMKISEGVV